MAKQRANSAQLKLSRYTDANGWVVHDYGEWKEYTRGFDFGGGVSYEWANIALPVGKNRSNIRDISVSAIVTDNGQYGSVYYGIKYTTNSLTSSTVNVYRNVASGSSGGGTIHLRCRDA